MFTNKTNLPQYEYILFRDSVNNKTLSHITETDAARLIEMIQEEIGKNNLRQAELYAEKLAIYHGVPGLIQYYNIMLRQLKSDIDEDETVEQEACNVLAYLYLAKNIYEADASSANDLIKFMPDEKINSKDYWQKKVSEMRSLIDLSHFDAYAASIARGMFNHKNFKSDQSQTAKGRK